MPVQCTANGAMTPPLVKNDTLTRGRLRALLKWERGESNQPQ